MTQIRFRVYGDPKGQPRVKAFARGKHAGVYDPGTADGWKALIAYAAKEHLPERPLEGPLRVDCTFIFKRPKNHYGRRKGQSYLKDNAPVYHIKKPDRDNCDKAVMDILSQCGMWGDDCQVCDGCIQKLYASGDVKPGAIISITKTKELS